MTATKQLESIEKFIDEMNTTNSLLDKQAILKKHPEMKGLLGLVYGPEKFNITSDVLKKNPDLKEPYDGSLEHLLNSLSDREVTGHAAIARVNGFIFENGCKETVYKILDKDLEIRVGASVINKVFPGCVEVFEVALANSYKDVEKKVNIFDGGWYASRKMDGVRCIAVVDAKGEVSFFSREGKPFDTFGVLAVAIEKLGVKNVVFDGECCIVDKNGKEDFKAVTKEMRKKDHVIANPKYLMFDMLTTEEFFSGSSTRKLSERLAKLQSTVEYGLHLEVLHQEVVTETSFDTLQEKVKSEGWEGLILRKNVGYKAKRSNDLLKLKEFKQEEYKVVRCEMGPFRVIKNQVEACETMLTNVIILHKGNEVSVGSGFSIEERRKYFKYPEEIVGKIISVRYFEETLDSKTKKNSLRFPIYKGSYGDVRDV